MVVSAHPGQYGNATAPHRVLREGAHTIPHAAFNGQTPDEMYFGNGDAVVIDLSAAHVRARQERMKANRAATCGVCARGHDFGALQLQRAECGMP